MIADWRPPAPQDAKIWEARIVNSQKVALAAAGMKDVGKADKYSKALVALLLEWRMYAGVSTPVTAEETRMNALFIIENFGDMSLLDIKNAYNMSIAGELGDFPQHHNSFAPMYIAQVLRAYKSHAQAVIARLLRERTEQEIAKGGPEPTQEELHTIMVASYRTIYLKVMEGSDPTLDRGGVVAARLWEQINVYENSKKRKEWVEAWTAKIHAQKNEVRARAQEYEQLKQYKLENLERDSYLYAFFSEFTAETFEAWISKLQ